MIPVVSEALSSKDIAAIFERVLGMSELSSVFGIPPTSLEAFIQGVLTATRS